MILLCVLFTVFIVSVALEIYYIFKMMLHYNSKTYSQSDSFNIYLNKVIKLMSITTMIAALLWIGLKLL